MANAIIGAIKQIPSDVAEAVVKPVVDEVGKGLEEGVYTVLQGPSAKPLDPAVQQKKKDDEDKRKQWALKVIDWNQKLANEQAKVRQQKQQELQAKAQQVNQEEQVKKVEEDKKKQDIPAELKARNTTEQRKGVGG